LSIDKARQNHYNIASTNLACLSNEKLIALLAKAKPLHEGIGGTSALISVEGTKVFIKKT